MDALHTQSTTQLISWCRKFGIRCGPYTPRGKLVTSLSRFYAHKSKSVGVRLAALQHARKRRRLRPAPPSEYVAVRRLQRFFRRYVQPLVNREDLDLEHFAPTAPPFRHVADATHVYRFVPQQLVAAMLRSGNFENPYTRQPLNRVELLRLTHAMRRHDATFPWNLARLTDRELIKRNAMEEQNTRENVALQEHLIRVITQPLFAIPASCAQIMLPHQYESMVATWRTSLLELVEPIFVLERLDSVQCHTVVMDLLQRILRLAGEPGFSDTFRLFLVHFGHSVELIHDGIVSLPSDTPLAAVYPYIRSVMNWANDTDTDDEDDDERREAQAAEPDAELDDDEDERREARAAEQGEELDDDGLDEIEISAEEDDEDHEVAETEE